MSTTSEAVRQNNNSLITSGNPYKGTQYEQMWNMNPYKDDYYGATGLWDKIGNAFGFRTAEDKYETERKTANAQYLSEIEAMKVQNEYNSEEAVAQRMRDAGINPDLQQISDTGSVDFNAPEGPGAPEGNEQAASLLGDFSMKAIQLAFGMYSGMLDVDEKIARINEGITQEASNLIQMGFTSENVPIIYSKKKFQKQLEENFAKIGLTPQGEIWKNKNRIALAEGKGNAIKAELLAPIIENNQQLIKDIEQAKLNKSYNEEWLAGRIAEIKNNMSSDIYKSYEKASKKGKSEEAAAAAMLYLAITTGDIKTMAVSKGFTELSKFLGEWRRDKQANKLFGRGRD